MYKMPLNHEMYRKEHLGHHRLSSFFDKEVQDENIHAPFKIFHIVMNIGFKFNHHNHDQQGKQYLRFVISK